MKIEQVLIHYLLKNKQLVLQGLGLFKLEASLPDTADPDRPIIIPEDAISFHYDPKADEDKNLVDFIVEYTGKIRPLAASDLESYLMLGRQFLNIGNPFIIPNIGTLHKTNSGALVFKGGQHALDRVSPQREKIEDEGAEAHDEDMFNEYQRQPKSNNSRTILLGVSILIIAFIAWAVWRYAFNTNEQEKSLNTSESVVPLPLSDTLSTDSLNNVAPVNNGFTAGSDSFSFKILVNEYTTLQAAQNRVNNLKTYGRNVILYTNDSIMYKVAEPFVRPLQDTSIIIDSLKRYYGSNRIRVELN